MTTFQHIQKSFDINQGFLNNYKDSEKSLNLFKKIIVKEYSIMFLLSTSAGKNFPTFDHYIENNTYNKISNYANIIDYDNCVICLLDNTARIKETENPDIRRELRSINNMLACLATYCKDCPAGIEAKDFL